jgi:hypothetical protein
MCTEVHGHPPDAPAADDEELALLLAVTWAWGEGAALTTLTG